MKRGMDGYLYWVLLDIHVLLLVNYYSISIAILLLLEPLNFKMLQSNCFGNGWDVLSDIM